MSRLERVVELVGERELDLAIVGDLVTPGESGREAMADVFWLTGFAGTSGACLVGPQAALFITDYRYAERAARTVPADFERVKAERQLLPAIAERLRGRVGFEEAKTSVRTLRRLEELAEEGVELVAVDGFVERLRRQKDERELDAIAEAARLADAALEDVLGNGVRGRTERDIARELEARIRELGAELSFPAIVASGPNGALPHAEPSEREIEADELVVVDYGALLDGYCSDCTRTLATGTPGSEEREAYDLVLSAQLAALAAVGAGVEGRAADAAAREPITAAGHGDHFGHGIGHGVGIQVHEAPRLAQRSEDVLEAGDVVTVEPGVYVPGRYGVRIEDLVAVTVDGHRNLSSLGKDLRVVG